MTYGFKRQDKWIEPTLRYTPQQLTSANDDRPGRIEAGKDISGASFYSFLTYSAKWDQLTETQKQAFKQTLPFGRGTGTAPGVSGYFESDKTYGAGGVALSRSSVRS